MNYLFELFPIIGATLGVGGAIYSIVIAKHPHPKSSDHFGIELYDLQTPGSTLSPKQTSEGIFKLVQVTHDLEPDFVVGINRGGTMIGAYLSLMHGVPSSNFLRCYVPRTKREPICDSISVHGNIIVVDDICRSGNTMRDAVNFFKARNPNIKRIYSVSLAAVFTSENSPSFNDLYYFAYKTTNKKLSLPWTCELVKDDFDNSDEIDTIKEIEFNWVKEKPVEILAREVSENLRRLPNRQWCEEIWSNTTSDATKYTSIIQAKLSVLDERTKARQ